MKKLLEKSYKIKMLIFSLMSFSIGFIIISLIVSTNKQETLNQFIEIFKTTIPNLILAIVFFYFGKKSA